MQTIKRPFSAWLHSRLAQAHSSKTVALLVDKSEVETLECLKPHSTSLHFRQDLDLDKRHWIYSQDRRILVVQQDSTEKDMAKHMRDLGTMTCAQLQARKASDVEVICSGLVNAQYLGVFYNSFHLTNYDWTLKSNIDEEKKDVTDERLLRKTKLIDNFEVLHETAQDENFVKQVVMAQATTFARNLANTRASTATPCYMEAQVLQLCNSYKDAVKEIRVVKG